MTKLRKLPTSQETAISNADLVYVGVPGNSRVHFVPISKVQARELLKLDNWTISVDSENRAGIFRKGYFSDDLVIYEDGRQLTKQQKGTN